jgi:hypothetical protein
MIGIGWMGGMGRDGGMYGMSREDLKLEVMVGIGK